MKLIQFSVLIFICSGLVTSKAANKSENNPTSDEVATFPKNSQCRQNTFNANKTEFTDMNVDCQLMIMDELELLDLIAVAATNEHFQLLAADVFRRKYAVKTVEFRLFRPTKNLIYNLVDKQIQIEDYDLMLDILTYFGHTIKDLTIHYENFEMDQTNQINNYMNTFCSQSLIQLILKNCKRNVFEMIRRPFKCLESVAITGGFEKLTHFDLTLNEMFPNIRRLDLTHVKVADPDVVNRYFPHLEHFTVSFMHSDGFTEQHIEKLIEKNPQIRGLELMNSSYAFLNFLSIQLPQLEELQLIWTTKNRVNYIGYFDIHFKNVKKLMIEADHQDYPGKLKFDRLEELRIDCFNQLNDDWIDFIVKSKTLRYFILSLCTLDDQQLLKLAENLPDLVEFTTTLTPNTQIETIVQFLQRSEKLKKLYLLTFFGVKLSEIDLQKLHRQLESEWDMSSFKLGLLFNRKS